MKFLKKIGEKLGLIEENRTEKIMEERSSIKENLAVKLKESGFDDYEINEVLDIITKAEADVQKQKDLLIGTNINNLEPNIIMREIFEEIRRIQLKSGEDIKLKIAEIKARKGI